jgi:hypothetical protein
LGLKTKVSIASCARVLVAREEKAMGKNYEEEASCDNNAQLFPSF